MLSYRGSRGRMLTSAILHQEDVIFSNFNEYQGLKIWYKIFRFINYFKYWLIYIFGFTNNILRRRQWHPTPVLLPGKSQGWRSLVGCSPWGHEESDTTERLHFHFPLPCIGEGNGNPLQCSCLETPRNRGAWWLPSVGSHRVGHDWSDLAAATIHCLQLWGQSARRQCKWG